MYWFPVIRFPRCFSFTTPPCYLVKVVLLCIHSVCVPLVVCHSVFVFIRLLCSLAPSVLYVCRLFIKYSQHLDPHLCLLIHHVTATQHLTTGFTKIISGLRSISTLHQLLMNTLLFFIKLSLNRLFKHVLLCLWKFFLSFKHFKMHNIMFHISYLHIMQAFPNFFSSEPLSPNIFT